MSISTKSQTALLAKLGIAELNPMQESAQHAIESLAEVVLISPTGTGKTVAFLLPLLGLIDPDVHEVQLVILVPSRELAIQIEQVLRDMGTGFKVNAVYGGRSGTKERLELKHPPAILIGTPGRVADHLRREAISTALVRAYVLDEFDKSLEVGFEPEMKAILATMPNVKKKVLTSATTKPIPAFVELRDPKKLVFNQEDKTRLKRYTVMNHSDSMYGVLVDLINHLESKNGILFCNFKDSIAQVAEVLERADVSFGMFYGGMEQVDRERSLIKFRNGTYQYLLATDLAARGIDVPEIDSVIHVELPFKAAEFVHRNGRTARVTQSGAAYIIQQRRRKLPSFIGEAEELDLDDSRKFVKTPWTTLFISGGRKDKISKGDIAGLFLKQGGLDSADLGTIELKTDCAFVAVKQGMVDALLGKVNNARLKKKKVRIYEV